MPVKEVITMAEHAVFLQIYQRLAHGDLVLPSLPDIGLRVREAVRDPNQSLGNIARLVQLEPPLAAYLVSVANSPLFRGAKPVDSCQAAVSRLGLSVTANLVMSYSLKSLFATQSSLLTRILRQLWERSVYLSALSCVLAKHLKGYDPDRALLAGLLQDIGALPIVANLVHKPEVLSDTETLAAILEQYTVPVGTLLLKHWNFDAEMLAVVASREQWRREHPGKADLADIVLLARLHSHAGTPLMRRCPKLKDIPAFSKLPLTLEAEDSLAILVEARQDVAAVQRLMAG